MKLHRMLALILFGALPGPAFADDAPADHFFSLSGFGTVGAGYHGSEGLVYRRDLEQAGGYEGGRVGFRMDSRIGVQLNATFSPRLGAMVQSISQLSRDGDWAPEINWAFVRYSPTEWLDLRFGRLGADIYLNGDSRHVGYAFTSIRPSPEVYGLLAEDRFDGMDMTFSGALGQGIASLKLYGGHTRGGYYLYGRTIENDKIRTLGATLQWSSESLTLRAAWSDIYASDDESLQPLAAALRSVPAFISPDAAVRAGEIGHSHRIIFAGLGALYDNGPLSIEALLGWQRFDAFPDYEGWAGNVLVGYRIGSWKPYIGYGRNNLQPNKKPLSLPPLTPGLAQLQATYDEVIDRLHVDQRTVTAGVRYDFAPNAALKMQIDHTDAAYSPILLDDRGMSIKDRTATLYSIVVDFLF